MYLHHRFFYQVHPQFRGPKSLSLLDKPLDKKILDLNLGKVSEVEGCLTVIHRHELGTRMRESFFIVCGHLFYGPGILIADFALDEVPTGTINVENRVKDILAQYKSYNPSNSECANVLEKAIRQARFEAFFEILL